MSVIAIAAAEDAAFKTAAAIARMINNVFICSRCSQLSRLRPQAETFRLSVNGNVISQPYIDYKLFPNGLPAYNGIQVDVASLRAAHDLAARLNR
jgi:hypothetical protein